ncbi:MAG: Smr/MutS family protein [Acidobacteriota bacterium]
MKDNPILRDKFDPPPLDLDEELTDDELLQKAMAEVKPLQGKIRKNNKAREKRDGHRTRQGTRLGPRGLLEQFMTGDGPLEWSYVNDYIQGPHQPHPLLLKKLQNGGFSIQAELDLHGLYQEEARQKVEIFIKECNRRQLTCVRIIHGKGNNSPNHIPVLKNKIPAWLAVRRLSRYVVAYTSARPVDGGEGAIYLLLRTQG